MPTEKEVWLTVPRRDMRWEATYLWRIGETLWETAQIYCLPKIRGKAKKIEIVDNVIDSEDNEDGYMVAALMWQRSVYKTNCFRVSNDLDAMEQNALRMMLAIEQQEVVMEPFEKEGRKGLFRYRQL